MNWKTVASVQYLKTTKTSIRNGTQLPAMGGNFLMLKCT